MMTQVEVIISYSYVGEETERPHQQTRTGFSPLSSSMRAGMMPDLANMAAHDSSMDTVPIMITTSRMRSSSAEPVDEGEKCLSEWRTGGATSSILRNVWREPRRRARTSAQSQYIQYEKYTLTIFSLSLMSDGWRRTTAISVYDQ